MNTVQRILAAAILVLLAGCQAGAPPPVEPRHSPTPAPSTVAPPTVKIASLNCLRLGHGRKKLATDESMKALAAIVARYDLIALQEVMIGEAPEELAKALEAQTPGVSWRSVVSTQSLGRGSYREFYALVYRTDRVQHLPAGSEGIYPDSGDVFVREPFYASFKAGKFDFTIIVVHLDSPGHTQPLSEEIRHLDRVWRHVQDLDPAEQDVIMMGDFNRGATAPEYAGLRAVDSMEFLLNPPPKTSLGDSGPANPYDQIWIQERFTGRDREWTGKSDVFDFVKAASGDYKRARVETTDHLPVWVEFRTNVDDDP